VQEISDRKADAIREAVETCRESERLAQERAETKLAELGERPTLAALEANL